MNKDKRNNIKLLGTLNNADESGIIANANQIYDANEDKSTQDVSKEHKERIETLEDKENSMQTTLENITKTGEANAASNVTYNHNDSKLDATNVQQAVDEIVSAVATETSRAKEAEQANTSKLGYYVCETAAATAAKAISATSYVLSLGGSIKIKMTNANTVANATLNINSTGAKPLYYDGERASANNSWEAGETVEVYYDGTNFYANNVAGGGGKAEKIKYDNLESGLDANNVQEALDCLDSQINGRNESVALDVESSSYVVDKYTDGTRWLNTTQFTPTSVVPIEGGSSITIIGNASHPIKYAIFKTYDTSISPSGQIVTSLKTLSAGGTVTIEATENGHFLYLNMSFSSSIKYPQSVTQSSYVAGMRDELAAMNKFQTNENLADVSIDDEPTENSNGLVKSGYLFGALNANEECKYDTPLLTGSISGSYKNYKISAGKKVYENDIIITKLIFNKNIESAATDTTFIYYVATPNSTSLGTAYSGTIAAGTNYANVNIKIPTGKIIYVLNKQIVSSGTDAHPTDCLIAGVNGLSEPCYAIDPFERKTTINAGFSYEYYIVVSLKEYVDFKDEKINQRIDEYHTNKVSWADAKTILAFGSSLTDQRYAPAGHIWLEEINHLIDANIINYSYSGHALANNISTCIGLNLLPNWILWNNQANLTPFGMNGYIQLSNAKEITESKGASMLLGGENGTASNISLVNIDRLFDVFAKDNHIPRSELRRELVRNVVNTSYQGLNGGVHYGWRMQSPFIIKHLELLGSLPIDKNVKIYKIRPNSANLEITALGYDTPLQRVKHFYALSTGVADGGTFQPNAGTFNVVDNIGQSASYYADASSESRTTILTRETETFRNGGAISIPYGKAVVEFVLDKENVNSGKLSFNCSTTPHVYVSISHNSSTSYTDNPRSTWQLLDGLTYADGVAEVKVSGNIELGDKVKFLVVCSDSFTISKPSFEYEGGRTKKTPVLNYKPRRYGTELNSNRYIDSNWQLGGNAEIKQIPNAIGYYKANTSHIELTDNGDYAERTVTIPAGTKKVAIRVMATRFIPLMTKRFNGTDAENSEYVSTVQAINTYDCDLGVMDIIIDDAAVSRQVICPGFAWSYVEYATELTATSLKVQVRKSDNDTAPTMVYALSVQVIE